MKKIVPLAILAFMMASCGEEKKDYDATGTFEATEVTVSAESSGQLISFNVTEGQLLNGGLTVGQIDSRQLALKREQLATSSSMQTTVCSKQTSDSWLPTDKLRQADSSI